MKKIFRYLGILVVAPLLQSCSTTFMAATPYDEVYDTRPAYAQTTVQAAPGQQNQQALAQRPSDNYSQPSQAEPNYRDYSAAQQQYSGRSQQGQSQEVISQPDRQVSYYDDDNFSFDDYYDYSYSVRIKRFHRPVYGFGYYDDYYTNLYWYTYDPWVWGTSVYLGYDWWWWDWYGGPYFSLGFNWGWGSIGWHWGYPFSGWYYYPHFFYRYPWTPWYAGWGYWVGYHHGWWDGYWFGSYYNPLDPNSYYYGPRISRSETSGARRGGGSSIGSYNTGGYDQRRISSSDNNAVPNISTGTITGGAGTAQESLNQRRINASGVNNSASGTTHTANQESTNLRIKSENATTQAVTTPAVNDGGNNRRIPTGNTNVSAPGAQASEGNPVNPRINASRNDAAASRPAEQPETGRQNAQGRVTNIGGEQVRIGYDNRAQETPASGYTPQDDQRVRQAQERYARPRTEETPVQRYDYNRYRREAPQVNREELARPRTETPNQEGRVRSYTPPTYNQPKRSDVYTSPRTYGTPDRTPQSQPENQGSGERYNAPQYYQQPSRQYNSPSVPQRQYNAPSTQENRRSYTPPVQPQPQPRRESSGSSEYRSTPSRSYESPSYTPSYSAPSRSSGSFNSSGSGSSSSGRRR